MVLVSLVLDLYHSPQVLEWTSLCLVRFPRQENLQPQPWQMYGLIPVCMALWVIKLSLYAKALGQNKHVNGFSPVWDLSWTFSWPFQRNFFLQYLQTIFFSDTWIFIWAFKLCLLEKSLSQMLHWFEDTASHFESSWDFNKNLCLNFLPHLWQM